MPAETPGPGAGPGSAAPRLSVVPAGRSLAEAVAGRPAATGRTLRVALALRGGVSLAVWIGGALAELDVLRRLRLHRDPDGQVHAFLLHPGPDPGPSLTRRAGVYARLLVEAGYDRVEFDVLAGASAGGLNAVVHAVAQRSGAGLDALAGLWERGAGLSRLLRPLGRGPVDSLLRGDEHLWPELESVLHAVHTGPGHPDLVAEHVTVELSATVLDGDPAAPGAAAEGRAGFRFTTPTPGAPAPPPGSTVPARPGTAPDDAAALSRLAYAARATASFPGAFEPAAVWSAPTPGPLRRLPRPDLTHAFSAHRDPRLGPYRVIDGGVFDNVPVDRALEAARTRRSLRHADRCLLYLDPDPPARPAPPARDLDLPRLARTLAATLTRLRRRETGQDEVLALADWLAGQRVARSRLHQLAPLLERWDPAALEERARAHLRHRARTDARLLVRVLTRPARWQLRSSLPERSAVRARTPAELEPLGTALVRRAEELAHGPLDDPAARAVLEGPAALADAAAAVLAWVRALEDVALDPQDPPPVPAGLDLGAVRADAYAVLAGAGHAQDRLLRDVLAATAAPGAPVTEAVAAWWRPGGPAEGWDVLDAAVAALRTWRPAPPDADRPAWAQAWAVTPWSRLPAPPAPLAARDLPPALAAAGVPGAVSRIAYGEVRGDQPPAPGPAAGLERAAGRERLQQALHAPEPTDEELDRLLRPVPGRVPAAAKLAGTGLLNFQGFLAAAWRADDWWWGRLDAAAGAAGFLARLSARGPDGAEGPVLGPPAADPAAVRDHRALQEALVAARDGGAPGGAGGLPAGGADGLGRLSPGYRTGLASRGLRVLGRALAGTPDLPRAVWEAGLFVLGPLLVLAPLLLTPVRAAAALVAGAAGLGLAAAPGGGPAPGWTGLVAAAAAVLAVSLVRSARRGRHRWSRVRARAGALVAGPRPPGTVPPAGSPPGTASARGAGGAPAAPGARGPADSRPVPGPVPPAVVAAAGSRAARRAGVLAAAAVAMLLPAAAAAVHGHGTLVLVLLGGAVAAERAAAALLLRLPPEGAPDEPVRAGVVVLAAVALWVPAALVPVPPPVLPPGAPAALALTAVGLLVLTGFLRPAPAVALAAGAALAGAAWAWAPLPGPAATAAGALTWAALLWWAPTERMLRPWAAEEELRPGPAGTGGG
ncbi:DUF3376 domain-containing protein [Kocuria flava]|uniref:DUF3376 domain-containing protein n=1 Tax=Kocuria flava TaxID=446860 RepID=UPI000C7B36D7|nr:DUF3376 domain-containing protein [Kocuria flava]